LKLSLVQLANARIADANNTYFFIISEN